MREVCEFHALNIADAAVIKNDLAYIRRSLDEKGKKIDDHIEEAEAEGGIRDRVRILEDAVSALKKAEWTRLIVASVIGGLFARLAPDMIGQIAGMVLKLICR